ncbi:MAG: hypothetical protein JWL58_4517 [Streptosporangiaceae bacterium]|nr:hypothetical protein [Streptosporangiaceae bacterium]
MDFWGTVVVVFRRWYVTLPAFVLALGATMAVYSTVKTTYVSNAVVVLTTSTAGGALPSKPGLAQRNNPLLSFDKGLNMSAAIVVAALETPEEAAKVGVTPAGDPTFTVNNGSANPEALVESPFVFISGESTSPQAAQDIVKRVMAEARQVLTAHQRALDAPLPTYISMNDVAPPTAPVAQRGRKLRAAAVAMVIGIVASLCAAFVAESIAQGLQRRTSAAPPVSGRAPEELGLDGPQPVWR